MKRYDNFKQQLRQEVERWLGSDYYIEFEVAIKNNGIVEENILIQHRDEGPTITISMSSYWDRFRRGGEMQEVIAQFQADYGREKVSLPFTGEQLLDFNQVKDRVVYRLINADLNRELLTQVPYIPLLDLAIVFSLNLWSGEMSQLYCLIHHRHLELWGIAPEELYPLAAENTPRLLPLRFHHIYDVIGYQELEDEPLIPDPQMYVFTNQLEVHGAAALLYPNALKEAAVKLDSDLLILPSSIHEVLVVPKTDAVGGMELEEMVRGINESDVLPEDILSYHVYLYDRKTEQLTFFKDNRETGEEEYGTNEYGTGTKDQ